MNGMLERVPTRLLRVLDSWRFWMTIAFVALAAIVVWQFFLTQRSIKEQSAREARIQSDYQSCIRSIPSLTKISRHVEGVNELAVILVRNSKSLIHTPPLRVRQMNYALLVAAQKKIAAVKSFPVPTVASCEARRRQLGG